MVLSFILIQNRQGKTRLAKWYAPYTDEEKVKLKGEASQSHPIRYLAHPNIPPGPPTHRPPRPKIPIQLRRVSFRPLLLPPHDALLLAGAPEPLLHQDRLPPVRGAVLLRVRRRE